jgi:hypothetical protein
MTTPASENIKEPDHSTGFTLCKKEEVGKGHGKQVASF